jgi:hypothetical protein
MGKKTVFNSLKKANLWASEISFYSLHGYNKLELGRGRLKFGVRLTGLAACIDSNFCTGF